MSQTISQSANMLEKLVLPINVPEEAQDYDLIERVLVQLYIDNGCKLPLWPGVPALTGLKKERILKVYCHGSGWVVAEKTIPALAQERLKAEVRDSGEVEEPDQNIEVTLDSDLNSVEKQETEEEIGEEKQKGAADPIMEQSEEVPVESIWKSDEVSMYARVGFPVLEPEDKSDLSMQEKLDKIEKIGHAHDDLMILSFVELMREKLALDAIQESAELSAKQLKRLDELNARLLNIEKAMRFCNDFIWHFNQEKSQSGETPLEKRLKWEQRDEDKRKKRLTRLKDYGELIVNREEKVIKVAKISKKTLDWLKSLMDVGIFDWEDRFVFEICDRSWVLNATHSKTVETCLELFWHLMLTQKFFPTDDVLIALSTRTGTPSIEEFTKILCQPTRSAWVKKTKEFVTTEKGVTDLEFRAMLGDIDAQKKLEKTEQK